MIGCLKRLKLVNWLFCPFVFILLYLIYLFGPLFHMKEKIQSGSIFNSIIEFDPVIVDANIVGCSIDAQKCSQLVNTLQFRFGLYSDQFIRFKKSSLSRGMTFSNNSVSFIEVNSQGMTVDFYFSQMLRQAHYWLIPGEGNLSDIRLPFSSIVSIGVHETSSYQIHLPFSSIFPLKVKSSVNLSDLKLLLYRLQQSKFIECKKELAEKIRNENPEMYWENNTIIHPSYVETMAELVDFMYQIGIYPVLTGGTLLGWYRECSIIPHTTDIDFLVFSDNIILEKEMILKKIRERLSFCTWGRTFGVLNETYQELYEFCLSCKNIKVDFFAYYNDGNISWVGGTANVKQKLRWSFPSIMRADNVCTGELFGYLFFVPCDVESFLVPVYGAEWHKIHHTKTYNWLHSGKNVELIGNWS